MFDVTAFINTFGYFGVFLISMIGSGVGIIPLPSFVVVIAAGAILDPILVGLAAGFGAAVGELVAYVVGLGVLYGHSRLKKKKRNRMKKEAVKESKKPCKEKKQCSNVSFCRKQGYHDYNGQNTS